MTEDILEKAKAADPETLAVLDWGALRDLISGLITEVERLRSENKIISDRAAHHEKQDAAEIELLAARIKELEALNELNHKNMRSWLDTTTDKEFLDKLSSEIGFKDAYIKRLEAAFLKLYVNQLVGCNMLREVAEKHARKALERIRSGEKDD